MGLNGNQKCPLIFFILRYIKHHPHIYLNIYKKNPEKISYGFQFWWSWGPDAKIQKHPTRVDFFKIILKVHLKISPLPWRLFLRINTTSCCPSLHSPFGVQCSNLKTRAPARVLQGNPFTFLRLLDWFKKNPTKRVFLIFFIRTPNLTKISNPQEICQEIFYIYKYVYIIIFFNIS